MDLDLTHNVADVRRDLSDAARRQLPFATALALTDAAKATAERVTDALSDRLDRPSPFTRRAYRVRAATKRRPVARVEAKPIQADYLARLEGGGTDTPDGRALVIPTGKARRNKYGNMPRGKVGRLLAKPSVFSGAPRGRPPGVYERTRSGGLRMLVYWGERARYAPRLGFVEDAKRAALAAMPDAWVRAFRRAMETRRR